LRLPKHIRIARENWVRMMFCVKHLMKLHPEYNDMLMDFYAKMYEKYPYNEEDPFNFDDEYKPPRPRTSIERHLDDLVELNNKEKEEFQKGFDYMIWEMGLKLPSWENNKDKGEDHDKK